MEIPFHVSWKKHKKLNFLSNDFLKKNSKEQKILGVILSDEASQNIATLLRMS